MLLPPIIVEGISILFLRCNSINEFRKGTIFRGDKSNVAVFSPGLKVISIPNLIRVTYKQPLSLDYLHPKYTSLSAALILD